MNVRTWQFGALILAAALTGCATESRTKAVPASSPAAASEPSSPAQPTSAQVAARRTPDAQPSSSGAAAAAPVAGAADVQKAVLGDTVPDFTLTDLDGKTHTLSSYRGKIVVLEWFSPACPYCVYAYAEGPLREQPERVKSQGVVWLSVNSQNAKHPGANLETNREFVKKHGLKAPILMDPSGEVGKAFGAKTTPHCYVINEKGLLVYAGALDNAPMGKVEGDAPRTNYVDAAIADLRSGHPVTISNTKPYG
jgi:peroxiredoxin